MKISKLFAFSLIIAAIALTGCASTRRNISYDPTWGDVTRINMPVIGVLVPVSDQRTNTRVYPKQIIIHTNRGGEKTFDINDRSVDEVIGEAFKAEIERMGVKLTMATDIVPPLDKKTSGDMKKELNEKYPDAAIAFGVNIKDFIATSQRKFFDDEVKITAEIEFNMLDLKTGDFITSDYKTEWADTVMSAKHNYMVDQLDKAILTLIQKNIRDNMTLRDTLVKIANQ